MEICFGTVNININFQLNKVQQYCNLNYDAHITHILSIEIRTPFKKYNSNNFVPMLPATWHKIFKAVKFDFGALPPI